MRFKHIIEQLLSESSDTVPASTLASYRKWCDANGLNMDDKASVAKFTKDISDYIFDVVKFN